MSRTLLKATNVHDGQAESGGSWVRKRPYRRKRLPGCAFRGTPTNSGTSSLAFLVAMAF